ncbi:helix-turn-helix domain-containing protein [Mucilaginibacter agri]|uniref:Helix-turn-helix domain-containing protein n=1 Tax=Mucilaginibacter agri TaxID=2695265 RepID=A0A966DS30_9SPHI|nr:helix-turn-helix transcriptional regulator [Mucilaginibacter agri]NCD67822.1 helix-turn-helix domain-containing protein [Mucilaginibacter agri]
MESKQVILKALGRKITTKRLENGLTQAQLATLIGKDQQSIQRLEAGNINPSYFYLYEIASGLNCEIFEILR